jgi:hypothetical protein
VTPATLAERRTVEANEASAALELDALDDPSPHAPHDRGSCRAMRARAREDSRPSRPVLADGMLKLMLILLAFFVFLHSRSELSLERSAPILDSLALRFAATIETASADAARSTALHLDPTTHFRRRLVGHLPISAGPVEVAGALLAFDLVETALFEPASAEIVRDRLVLLHRLAQALGEHEAGQGSQLVITTAWPDADSRLAAARLRTLEAIFADTPLDPSRLRLGLAGLPEGIWRFAIRADHGHAA